MNNTIEYLNKNDGSIGIDGILRANGDFPLTNANQVKGGMHHFNTIQERDAMPILKASPGMLAYVIETDIHYKLIYENDSFVWKKIVDREEIQTFFNGGEGITYNNNTGEISLTYLRSNNNVLEYSDGENWNSVIGDITSINVTTGLGLQGGASGTIGDITGNISLNHLGLENLIDPNSNSIFYWNNSTKKSEFLNIGDGLLINSGVLSNTIINNDQLINGSGYITADSSDTLTNKSGNISQWTNDVGYITDGNTNWNNTYGFITGINWDEITGNQLDINLSGFNNDSGFTTFDGDYNSLSNLPTIPTNNNQLINGAGYITNGNDGWVNTYGFITGVNWDEIGGLQSDINLSGFTNDVGFVSGDEFDSSGTYLNLRAQATTKDDVGLGNVENITLSTYTGNGGSLDNQYIINSEGYITGINWDGIGGTQSDINLSEFTNDIGFSTFDGDYNSLTNIPTYTQGSIIFADSDGSLTEDNSQLYWDNVNNRLGIGTNNPTFPVQIQTGGFALAIRNYITTIDIPNSILAGWDYSAVYLGYDYGSYQIHIGSLNTGDVRVLTQGNTIVEHGKLGVSTTSPTEKLDINNGNAKINGKIYFTDIADIKTIELNPDGASYINSGNLGIGTTTPTSPLHVKGTNTSYTTSAFRVENANTSAFIDVINSGNINQKLASFKSTSFGNGAGLFSSGTNPYFTAFGAGAGLSSTTGGYWTAVGANAGNSSTTGQFWNAFGFFAGHLSTTGNYWNAIGANSGENNTNGSNWIALGYQAARYYSGGTTAADSFSNGIYIGTKTKVAASGAQNEIVIGHEAEGIGSNSVVLGNDSITTTALKGNVGIGTTSPAEKLHIDGNVRTDGVLKLYDITDSQTITLNPDGNSYINGNLGIGTTTPSEKLDVIGNIKADGTLKLYDVTDIQKIELNPNGDSYILNGNIGIGISNPERNLHVADDVRIDSDLFVRTISTQYFSNTSNLNLIYGNAANFTIYSNTTERFRITSDGNVGIGTTTPNDKLDIDGDIRVKRTNRKPTHEDVLTSDFVSVGSVSFYTDDWVKVKVIGRGDTGVNKSFAEYLIYYDGANYNIELLNNVVIGDNSGFPLLRMNGSNLEIKNRDSVNVGNYLIYFDDFISQTLFSGKTYRVEDFPLIWINDLYYNTYKDNTFVPNQNISIPNQSEYDTVTSIFLNIKSLTTDFTGTLLGKFNNLSNLQCVSNQISVLDVSQNTNLTQLICYDNQIQTLDVSQLVNLNRLSCQINQIQTLDVSQLVNLNNLQCKSNQLDAATNSQILIDLDTNGQSNGILNSSIFGGGFITPTGIDSFNSLLSKSWNIIGLTNQISAGTTYNVEDFPKIWIDNLYYNTYKDNTFVPSVNTLMTGQVEYDTVTLIDLASQGLTTDFTNTLLSKFTNLEELRLGANSGINILDVSQNYKLDFLSFFTTSVTSVDLSNNPLLLYLRADVGSLTTLNIDNNVLLTYVNVAINNITGGLDCTNNLNLVTLIVFNNTSLGSLNVTNCNLLETLECQGCNLSVLDTSNKTVLNKLICVGNNLTSLDLTDCSSLVTFDAGFNSSLSGLDFTNCTLLDYINIAFCSNSTINISNNTLLTYIRVSYNSLTAFSVANNTLLLTVRCDNNQLDNLVNSQILIDLDSHGLSNGYLQSSIFGGGSLTVAGQTAKTNLLSKGWTIVGI